MKLQRLYTNIRYWKKKLKLFNTKENTEFYRKNNDISFDKKYIWDKKGSIDPLLRGWIPKDLYQVLKKFFNKKKQVEDILIRQIVKLNKWFHDKIWKPRNEKMIEWENQNNITQKDKKLSIKRNREI